MTYPTDLRYTKDHEWVRLSGDVAEVGITDYAQQQLGDVVYVDLPAVGTRLDGRLRLRHHRIGEGRVGAVRTGQRGSDRAERRAQGSSGLREHGARTRPGWSASSVDDPAAVGGLLDATQYEALLG